MYRKRLLGETIGYKIAYEEIRSGLHTYVVTLPEHTAGHLVIR